MVSNFDIETLIAEKRRELEEEKIALGLSELHNTPVGSNGLKNKNETTPHSLDKAALDNSKNVNLKNCIRQEKQTLIDKDKENIPPDLERYIRRYLGLPSMLKAGEFSPNNPLLRGARTEGDVMLGLGEYERTRNTLRRHRQRQYKEFLDQQARKKQESKEKIEKERREQEEWDRRLEQSQIENDRRKQEDPSPRYAHNYGESVKSLKVDTGVQVGDMRNPLSVAVQTEELPSFASANNFKTPAERELSPHRPAPLNRRRSHGCIEEKTSSHSISKGRSSTDIRPSYFPSILDAEAIHLRNIQAEKEAAERRVFYQQELKNQIMEQKRLREERRTREKMLEQAELRRLEEQLKILKVAEDKEMDKQQTLFTAMNEKPKNHNTKRSSIHSDVDRHILLRANSQPYRENHTTKTAYSDTTSKIPLYHRKLEEKHKKQPFSVNVSENSIFSKDYDVESYLRKHLNPSADELYKKKYRTEAIDIDKIKDYNIFDDLVENRVNNRLDKTKEVNIEELPIPILRHSPKNNLVSEENLPEMSEAMKIVEDKWKVPVMQKNIVKSLPNEDGKNISILTQLGSIRRQLQLEQLKLDNMRKRNGF